MVVRTDVHPVVEIAATYARYASFLRHSDEAQGVKGFVAVSTCNAKRSPIQRRQQETVDHLETTTAIRMASALMDDSITGSKEMRKLMLELKRIPYIRIGINIPGGDRVVDAKALIDSELIEKTEMEMPRYTEYRLTDMGQKVAERLSEQSKKVGRICELAERIED